MIFMGHPPLCAVALIALAVRLTSPGAALYHQRRVGLRGHIFMVHKFRSMRQDAEAATGAHWASPTGDARVTPIGGFLRKTRLDELPQLWNILVGEMSFEGPRPERPEFGKARAFYRRLRPHALRRGKNFFG